MLTKIQRWRYVKRVNGQSLWWYGYFHFAVCTVYWRGIPIWFHRSRDYELPMRLLIKGAFGL